MLSASRLRVEKVSSLETRMGPRGFRWGHQGVGLAALYGEEGTGVLTEWGAREMVVHFGKYVAGVVDNVKKKQSKGLFFFTLLVRLVLSKVHHHLPITPLGADTGTLLSVMAFEPRHMFALFQEELKRGTICACYGFSLIS
jgi:hypothetical protein